MIRRWLLGLPLLVLGCASFGKFAPGDKQAVHDACVFIDSGNPIIGSICATSEEIISIFSHVKASRAAHPGTVGGSRSVDICEAK